MIVILGHLKVNVGVLDISVEAVMFGKCREMSGLMILLMDYWLQYIADLDFPAKINRKLLTLIPSCSIE